MAYLQALFHMARLNLNVDFSTELIGAEGVTLRKYIRISFVGVYSRMLVQCPAGKAYLKETWQVSYAPRSVGPPAVC